MIIQIEGDGTENVMAAVREFFNVGYRWDDAEDIAPVPPTVFERIPHPTAVKVLVPPAALTVLDSAVRIPKRQRAKDLIDEAQYLARYQITTWLVVPSRNIELRTLTPDQLLGFIDEEAAR